MKTRGEDMDGPMHQRADSTLIRLSPGAPGPEASKCDGTLNVSGRHLASVALEPGQSPLLPELDSALAFVLDGALESAASRFPPGTSLAVNRHGPRVVAGPAGAQVGTVACEAALPDGWFNAPELTWFDKYEARVGTVLPGESPEATAFLPWQAYLVEIPAHAGPFSVHVHDHLTNIVFVVGPPSHAQGLVIDADRSVLGMELHGGDLVIVEPGVEHNLVPPESGGPLQFFVLNTSESDYEEEHESDYHNTKKHSRGSVTLLPRAHASSGA